MNDKNEVLTPEIIIDQNNLPMVTADAKAKLFAVIVPVRDSIDDIIAYADSIAVDTQDRAVMASEKAAEIADSIKAVQAAIEDHKREANRRWKLWTTLENMLCNPLDESRRAIKKKVIAYQQAEQDRIAKEQARLQAEADERARKEQERALREAEKLKTPELKEQRIEQAQQIVAPVINIAAPKPTMKMAKYWQADVVDPLAFFKALAERPELAGYVDVSVTKMQRAKSANPMIEIPGVKFSQVVR